MTRSKAYLFGGVEMRWSCAKELLRGIEGVPEKGDVSLRRRPEGLSGRNARRGDAGAPDIYRQRRQDRQARLVEWAVAWIADADGFLKRYCNTIPTPEGGTHEAGLRAALTRGSRIRRARRPGKRAAR